MQPASVGARVGAALIDLVPTIALFFLLAKLIGTWKTGDGQVRIELHNGAALVYVVLVLLYYFVFELVSGRTPGKLACGLIVVSADGSKVRPGQVLGRNLMRIVDFLPVFYLVGFIAVIANERNARLGDLAAKTAVVVQ